MIEEKLHYFHGELMVTLSTTPFTRKRALPCFPCLLFSVAAAAAAAAERDIGDSVMSATVLLSLPSDYLARSKAVIEPEQCH